MRRILFVGDVHATPEELEDCGRLMDLVGRVAGREHAQEIVLLGDSYHTFNVVRVEVMAFWREVFAMKSHHMKALVGNHDFAGEGLAIHSMMAHQEQIQVIFKPHLDEKRGILYLPYYSSHEAFLDACTIGGNTLVCHQTFSGSRYENGMYAPDGIDPELVPQKTIISGHIHAPQSFGKVTYIGAPRWRTLSDANTERAIWLYTFDDDGNVVDRKAFDTGDTCRQIRYVVDTPEEPFSGEIDRRHDWRVDVRGPADYVEARKVALQAAGARVRTFKTERSAPKLRESEGIGAAFRTYLSGYVPKYGTAADMLGAMARERLGV